MDNIYDLIIIGSGPAGLSAAIYAQRARLSCIIMEKNYVSGGQVINTYEVDNYPGMPKSNGFQLAQAFRAHAEELGAEFVSQQVEEVRVADSGIKEVKTAKNLYRAKAVIIATGAKHRLLQVPGEEELSGSGVSYCATCDGAFFKNKTVAVVGGGDVAAEDAIFLARGCERVYLIHRRDTLRAAKILQEKVLQDDKIIPVWDSVVTKIHGEDTVEAVTIRNVKTDEKKDLVLDGVFVAVGITPHTECFEGLLECNEGGYIKAGEDTKTNVPGIFAAGDVRTKSLRQIITAAADGANAVTAVQEYLLQDFV